MKLLPFYMWSVIVNLVHALWGSYTSISLSLCWSFSNKQSDSQSNCSQRVQPQASLLHTHTQTHTRPRQPELKKAQALSSVYAGLISATFMQFRLPAISAISLFSINLFYVSFQVFCHQFLILCCSLPPVWLYEHAPIPHFHQFAISRFTMRTCFLFSPPAQMLPHRIRYSPQICKLQLPLYTPHKPEMYTWFTPLLECSPSAHSQLIYLLLLTQQWVLNLSYLEQSQRVHWNFFRILFWIVMQA